MSISPTGLLKRIWRDRAGIAASTDTIIAVGAIMGLLAAVVAIGQTAQNYFRQTTAITAIAQVVQNLRGAAGNVPPGQLVGTLTTIALTKPYLPSGLATTTTTVVISKDTYINGMGPDSTAATATGVAFSITTTPHTCESILASPGDAYAITAQDTAVTTFGTTMAAGYTASSVAAAPYKIWGDDATNGFTSLTQANIKTYCKSGAATTVVMTLYYPG